MKKIRGIGLLELMLSMALISLLLVMATRYYTSARQNQQVNDAISLTEAIIAGTENWVIGKNGYQGVSIDKLIQNGYLPATSSRNPWHGGTTVTSGTNSNEITITMSGIPLTACHSFAEKINQQTVSPQPDPRSACTGNPATYSAVF